MTGWQNDRMTNSCKYHFLFIFVNAFPKLSGIVRKELPIKYCDKNADGNYAKFVSYLHDANHFYPSNITSKPWQVNVQLMESSIKHLKRSSHFKNYNPPKIKRALQNFIFIFFNALQWLILTHFEFFCFKMRWLGSKFNTFWKSAFIFKVRFNNQTFDRKVMNSEDKHVKRGPNEKPITFSRAKKNFSTKTMEP